jgi:hypothetical protein
MSGDSLTDGKASRIVCNVSYAGRKGEYRRPILFLPNRDITVGIPRGFVKVHANQQEYEASFAKIAINVMRLASSRENVLPRLLRDWFGDDAGFPGTHQKVVLELVDNHYEMRPATDIDLNLR